MGSTLILFARLILSLTVVIGLMWVAANVLRKRGFTGVAGKRASRGPEVELLTRRPLGRNASIAVVRVGARSLVLGVTEHQITKLDDIELTGIDLDEGNTWTVPSGEDTPTSAWKTMLDQMRSRTARH
ncbi:MAG TPA: flagellar biosynthetic protein FliO [Acidimicrobiia bacterium]|nr:flagellar biosynthetic protein FliO [Acidimicrobiia bacterium]